MLAAAEIPPDAIASPPSPTHQPDLKPCAAVRSEAAMLLKVRACACLSSKLDLACHPSASRPCVTILGCQ